MKKFIISILIICGILFFNKDRIIIPKESIRIRVIANSNSEDDQKIKYEVKNRLESEIINIIGESSNIDEVRKNINNNLFLINDTVKDTIKTDDYSVNFGLNYFPLKVHNGIVYDEGMYESVVVTLGSGLGDNWWCVLFPPFCLIEAEESDNIEYTWKVKELIDKYF